MSSPSAVAGAQVDLNPHQVDAALFAFKSPLSKGAILADEVALGKTIEAGLVLSQRWAERKRRILIITPSSLRKQWHQEMAEKFFLPCTILEAKPYNAAIKQGQANPFELSDSIVICSYHFARNKEIDVANIPWDLVVIDEAHRLRNVYKPSNIIANTLKDALKGRHKLLLTATPLQNFVDSSCKCNLMSCLRRQAAVALLSFSNTTHQRSTNMSYTQLTEEDRIEIYAMKKAGFKQCQIAAAISRHPSTISHELRRNTGLRGYRCKQAHQKAIERRREKAFTRITEGTWQRVDAMIRQEFSPEQICGRLALESQQSVSHETVYLHIYADKANGGDLHSFLRCQKKRKKRYGSNDLRGKIANRVSIDERPEVVEKRSRIGDWEADTIIGKGHSGAIVSLVERKSRYTLLRRLPGKHAGPVRDAIIELLMPFKKRTFTITKDNAHLCDHVCPKF